MSSSSPNPNPNPDTFEIEAQEEEMEVNGTPNWLELPEDVWFMILSKLKTFYIIENAQFVCRLFWNICKQPAMFNIIDTCSPHAYLALSYDVDSMTRLAVDRSAGGLVDITLLQRACDDHTLMYIVHRSKNLKRLVLLHFNAMFDNRLIKAVEKLPMLEELQLIDFNFSEKTMEEVGRACPSLKSFSLNQERSKHPNFVKNGIDDATAIAIARSMPQLRYLQLIGNCMSDKGLKSILDGCSLLESLDLRACFNVSLSGDLSKRCEKIKCVRYPNDSTYDYPWQTYLAWYNEWEAKFDAADYDDFDCRDCHDDYFDYDCD